MRARLPLISRESIDRAAIDGLEVVEVPGAHSRPPVLVPRNEMALALRLHRVSYSKHIAPLIASGRYSVAALRAIAAQVCHALEEGPLSTAEIRAAVTHRDARELLTGALIDLGVRGVIRRYPSDGRLDSPKYLYDLRHPDDRPDLENEGDGGSLAIKTTRLLLRRHGPATVDEIAMWAGLTKASIRKELVALRAAAIQVDGWTDEAWLLRNDVRAWNRFAGDDERVVLLPYRDPFVSVRRPPAVLAAGDSVPVLNAKLQPVAIRDVDRLNQHVIVASGELVGVWEYDPYDNRVVTRLLKAKKALRGRVADAVATTERFISEQLGDARLSAVDPPCRRAKRIAFCRKNQA